MSRYVIRRLLGTIPLLVGVAALSFIFMHLSPGGPTTMFAKNARMSQAQLDQIKHNMGLDEPVAMQFLIWLRNVFTGDLGTSYFQNRPVVQVIWDAFPNTVYLMLAGLSLSMICALLFGVVAAVRQHGVFDNRLLTLCAYQIRNGRIQVGF